MLLDTSAWIEFFIGSEKGRKVSDALEKEDCYTSIVSLAEISNWAMKENKSVSYVTNFIDILSSIIDLDQEISILAGKLNFERKKMIKKWGMLDSFILATATMYKLKILTKDRDFKDLEDVDLL